MSWRDEEESGSEGRGMGRPGGDWRGMRPSFDNPFSWSLPIMRVGGITVRLHLLFLLFVVIMLLRAGVPSKDDPFDLLHLELTAIGLGGLFVIVLAHEFGHCLACRWSGGEADEILMWPLGGLAFCRPPQNWKAHLITVAGGPAVNVVFLVVIGVMLGALTGIWLGVALPNPFSMQGLYETAVSKSLAHQSLFLLQQVNLLLLLFNLLPVFPLDGGRLLQAALWRAMGYTRSMTIAVRAGYVGALLLLVYGAVTGQMMLAMVAIFGGITCWNTQRQLQWTNELMGFESDEYAISAFESSEKEKPEKPSREETKVRKESERLEKEAQELDRVLQKIAASGLGSLSSSERSVLARETERKRKQR